MRFITLDLIKNKDFYKAYLQRINEIEKNMSNRTPNKIGLYCRWISVCGKKGDCSIRCSEGQDPDLQECVECYGLVYDNVTLSKLEDQFIIFKETKNERELYSDLWDATYNRLEKAIFDYMKKSITEFLEAVKDA